MMLVPTSAQPPAPPRPRRRTGPRGRPADRHPAATRTQRPRHHIHLPARHRQRRDHRHRARPTSADDPRERLATALIECPRRRCSSRIPALAVRPLRVLLVHGGRAHHLIGPNVLESFSGIATHRHFETRLRRPSDLSVHHPDDAQTAQMTSRLPCPVCDGTSSLKTRVAPPRRVWEGRDRTHPCQEGGIRLGASSPGSWSDPARGARQFEGSPRSLLYKGGLACEIFAPPSRPL